MGKVKDVLSRKGNTTLSVSPDTIVYDALCLMSEKNVGALLVLENEKLVGIFSERDYARKIILKGRTSLDTQVREIMTEDVITVFPEDTIEHCMELMSEKRIRHLPVVQGDKVTGVISIGDVVKFIIQEQESVIEHLKLYMSGK
ncbi:MAG: CBS domain-containing protein [Chitinophagaceae bacterium]|nr:CBS domain-containing protein [Chitinophagaceae bacterium]